MGKKILMVFITFICIIGVIKADYNYHTPIQGGFYSNTYFESPFSNGTTTSQDGYFEKKKNESFFSEPRNIYSNFKNNNDFPPLMSSNGMGGDPTGGGVGETPDDEDGDGLGGDPSGPGVGEDVPISDGLLILLILVCLYIFYIKAKSKIHFQSVK